MASWVVEGGERKVKIIRLWTCNNILTPCSLWFDTGVVSFLKLQFHAASDILEAAEELVPVIWSVLSWIRFTALPKHDSSCLSLLRQAA